jgi:hypothetical protein
MKKNINESMCRSLTGALGFDSIHITLPKFVFLFE